mmetsp:Transcript_46011/g.55798  ORF Transcript_46011/g.55798 Transcript_46011/m.55798 type:complete len:101 (-) Transcript_46011:497-799(-)
MNDVLEDSTEQSITYSLTENTMATRDDVESQFDDSTTYDERSTFTETIISEFVESLDPSTINHEYKHANERQTYQRRLRWRRRYDIGLRGVVAPYETKKR